MLHKVLSDVLFLNFTVLFVNRVKSTYCCYSMGSCETGSLHTEITDFFPLLSLSALYFRCLGHYLHTSKLNYNGKQTSPFTKNPDFQTHVRILCDAGWQSRAK